MVEITTLCERVARAIHVECLGEGAWEREPLPEKFREVARAAIEASGVEQLTTDLDTVVRALTPSAETKSAYIGEFSFLIDEQGEDGMCEVTRKVTVPWTTIKEIMAAIREQAGLSNIKREGVA